MNFIRITSFLFVALLAVTGCKTRQSGSGLASVGALGPCQELAKCDGPTCLVKKDTFFRGLEGDENFSNAAGVTDHAMLTNSDVETSMDSLGVSEKDGNFVLKDGTTEAEVWAKVTEARIAHAKAHPDEYTEDLAKVVADTLAESRQTISGAETPTEKDAAAVRARGLAGAANSLALAYAAIGKASLALPLREIGFQIIADADVIARKGSYGNSEFAEMKKGMVEEVRAVTIAAAKDVSALSNLTAARVGIATAMARVSLATSYNGDNKSAKEIMSAVNEFVGPTVAGFAVDRALALEAAVVQAAKIAGVRDPLTVDPGAALNKLSDFGVKGSVLKLSDIMALRASMKDYKPEAIDGYTFQEATKAYLAIVERKKAELPAEVRDFVERESKGGVGNEFAKGARREIVARARIL